jgi:ADP-ribose pyrophosphatase
MKDLTEETIASTTLVTGELLHVYRDEVMRPDGGRAHREWIKHMGASAVIALFPDDTLLLVRQYRYPPRREFLELPAGKLDAPDEDPADVAHRELEEETGWKADRMIRLASSHPCIGYSNEVIHFFLADGLTRGSQNLEDEEFVEVVSMPFAQAVDAARRGQLADMKTAFGILLAHAHRRSQGEETSKMQDRGAS